MEASFKTFFMRGKHMGQEYAEAEKSKKVYITKDKTFYTTLIRLAIPIVLQNMITFMVGFADNLMIGKLGDIAVSGVYMGNQFQTVLQMFTTGVEAAVLILPSTGASRTKPVSRRSPRWVFAIPSFSASF